MHVRENAVDARGKGSVVSEHLYIMSVQVHKAIGNASSHYNLSHHLLAIHNPQAGPLQNFDIVSNSKPWPMSDVQGRY